MVVQAPGRTTGSVYLGRVERGPGRLVLSGFRLINTVFADTADVAWISADRLVVLGRTPGGALQPLIVDLYGASVQSLGPIVSSSVSGPAIVSITAEPGQEVLASTDNGKIYRYLAIGWDQLTGGQYPSYPG